MKSQPTLRIKGVIKLSKVIFLIPIVSLLAAGNAQAKKPQPDPAPVAVDNVVSWSSDLIQSDIMEAFPRLCTLSQMSPDETSGTYNCALNDEDILYDFTMMDSVPIHRRGDDWRCNPGRFWAHIEPDVEYSFSWNGDCPTGCVVTIVNDFSNNGVIGGSVSRMTIEGYALAMSGTELNPFTEPQSLNVEYLHLTLFGVQGKGKGNGKGKGKVIAECELKPRADHPVTFVTAPVPLVE